MLYLAEHIRTKKNNSFEKTVFSSYYSVVQLRFDFKCCLYFEVIFYAICEI